MTTTGTKYLLISIHNNLYALDISHTAEVLDPPNLWPIPNAPAHYCGAMNFHNTIVAVMDLATILGLPPVASHDKTIVLDSGLASLALLVERVNRIISHDEVSAAIPSEKAFIQMVLAIPEGEASLLKIDELIKFATDNV